MTNRGWRIRLESEEVDLVGESFECQVNRCGLGAVGKAYRGRFPHMEIP